MEKKKKNENYRTTFPKMFGTWLESNFVFMRCVYGLSTSKIAYKSKAMDKDCFLQTTADVKRDIKSF